MNNSTIIFFPKFFSNKAILTFFITISICFLLFISYPIPFLWLVISSFTVIAFFHFLNRLTKSWASYSAPYFRRKIFEIALIIRVAAVFFLYFFFIHKTGKPYEFGAADSLLYNYLGIRISDIILNGELNQFNTLWYLGISDRGFPIYLGIIYALFFKSIIIARLLNALLGAWSCVLIYDFAKRNFNESAARITGIMVMLVPNLVYYCGLHLKETVMVFLVILSINLADKLLREKHITVANVAIFVATCSSVFLFRTVLAVCIILSFILSILIVSNRISGWSRRIFLVFWLIFSVILLYSSTIKEEIDFYIAQRPINQTLKMQHFASREKGNRLAIYGKKAVFFPLMIPGTLPTLVNTKQRNLMMLSGAFFTRNVYAFFVLVALILMFKRRKLRNHILLISFLFSYLFILASSGFAISGRFHLPVIPFLLVLAGYGISQANSKNTKYYVPYLIIISMIIIGWNWFKLAGRGMI